MMLFPESIWFGKEAFSRLSFCTMLFLFPTLEYRFHTNGLSVSTLRNSEVYLTELGAYQSTFCRG